MNYFEMKVTAVVVDPDNLSPMVILKDGEDKNVLPLWVGLTEAAAILTERGNIETERPMTHDLARNIISSLGGTVKKISIVDVRDGIYYATISIVTQGGEKLEIDARPSDAIALALRCKVPILAGENVIMKSRIIDFTAENVGSMSSEDLTEMLGNFSAEDFGKYKM